MIKTSAKVFIISILSLILYLFVPFKLVQILCLCNFFTVLLAFIYVKIISKKIVVERNLQTLRLYSGEKVEIIFKIKNYSRLPVYTIYINDNISYLYVYHNKNRILTCIRPREIKSFSYLIQAQQRGEFFAGPVSIRFYDPFFLFSLNKEIDAKMKIIVRPAKISLLTIPLPGLPQGNIDIKNICYEDITMRRSLREYKNGDELKRINWRASAKFNSLFTNEYQDTFDVPFFVFINLAEEDYRFEQRYLLIEHALELAANIVEKASLLKLRCGFAAYGSNFPYLPPAMNQTDLILDIISTLKMEKGKLPYEPEKKFKNQLPFGTQIFIIGPKEVDLFSDKILSENNDLNTSNLGISRSL